MSRQNKMETKRLQAKEHSARRVAERKAAADRKQRQEEAARAAEAKEDA